MKHIFISGIHPVIEALRSSQELDRILIQKDIVNEKLRELFKECYNSGIPVQRVPVERLNHITRKNHQGVIAFLSSIRYSSFEHIIDNAFKKGKDPLILILDRITDVRNFGAIARTAEGLGFDVIIIPETGSAQINEDAIKTSAGALHHLPVSRVKDLRETMTYLSDSGFRIIAAVEKAETELYLSDLTGPMVLVIGSEEKGIDKKLLKIVHESIKIPMYGKIESYNVSVSFAIIGYEIIRQRNF